jgi:hypothetical protein
VWLAPSDHWTVVTVAMGQCLQLALFALFVLATDPPGPSRRILAQWQRNGASALRRFMGPGIAKTALLLVVVFGGTLAIFFATGVYLDTYGLPSSPFALSPFPPRTTHTLEMAYFGAYALAFYGFLCGFTVFLRSRQQGRFSLRALLALVTFAAFTLPLFVAAILKVAGTDKAALPLAAPSPIFVFAMIMQATGKGSSLGFEAVTPGLIAIGGWAALGLVLGVVGAARARRQSRAQELSWKALDERLAAEDGAQAEEAPPAPPPSATATAEAAS